MSEILNFMDLSRQVKTYRTDYMKAIEKVLDDAAFSGGKYVEEFENDFAKYIGSNYCSALSSGTSALFMAMKVLGIAADDEVIIPANTFIASAWGACYCGAKPVFVDICSDTWEIDPAKIEEKITEKTRAIVGVHLYGNAFDFDAVKDIADKHCLYVVEDCAQAHGTLYKGKKVGSLGDIGCFSFYPGKNLGAFGEAGAIVTNNREYYEKIEIMKNHGAPVRYQHDVEGFNLRMDGIHGAVLSWKLKRLDEWNQKRRQIAESYLAEIKSKEIRMIKIADYTMPTWHLFEVLTEDVEHFMNYMNDNGISCGRHYPIPCHLQKVFAKLGYKKGDLPVAENMADHCVTLPLFPEMTREEVDRIITYCNRYMAK